MSIPIITFKEHGRLILERITNAAKKPGRPRMVKVTDTPNKLGRPIKAKDKFFTSECIGFNSLSQAIAKELGSLPSTITDQLAHAGGSHSALSKLQQKAKLKRVGGATALRIILLFYFVIVRSSMKLQLGMTQKASYEKSAAGRRRATHHNRRCAYILKQLWQHLELSTPSH